MEPTPPPTEPAGSPGGNQSPARWRTNPSAILAFVFGLPALFLVAVALGIVALLKDPQER